MIIKCYLSYFLCGDGDSDSDSDSTASIAGQLYGAQHGSNVLPKTWIEKLDIVEVEDKLTIPYLNSYLVQPLL